MSEVLVVVDHVDGAIRKPTYELLTLARQRSVGVLAVLPDAVELFTGPLRTRVRACAAENCELLFVDASRPAAEWVEFGDGCGRRLRVGLAGPLPALQDEPFQCPLIGDIAPVFWS